MSCVVVLFLFLKFTFHYQDGHNGAEGVGVKYMESVEESESELDIEVCFEDVYTIGQPVSTRESDSKQTGRRPISSLDKTGLLFS